ncbi:MAG: glycosyltransferase family 39 protein [Anaerolineae bacterium]|nr:glycosyltransferase family 39 protein [Anaerolineae bacterium]
MKRNLLLMLLILLLGAFIRIRGLTWGLPYIIEGDEYRVINAGLNIYDTGKQKLNANNEMGNYPPLRLQEVALTRAFLVLFYGHDIPVELQVMWGRVLSVFYSLLTIATLYQIGQCFTPQTGRWSAAFFASWPAVMWYGQLTLADSLAMWLFCLSLWWGIRAYQKSASLYGSLSIIFGVLAALAKYNMAFVLLIALGHRKGLLTGALVGAVFVLVSMQTANFDNFIYDYFKPDAQYQYADSVARQGRMEREEFNKMPRGWWGRIQKNAAFFLDDLSPYILIGALVGGSWRRSILPMGLLLLAGFAFITIGSLIATGGRQFFGVMLILILLAAYSLSLFKARRVMVAFGMYLILWQAVIAFLGTNYRTRVDTRAATVNWFIQHAPTETYIVSDAILYEFGKLNGYRSPKVFYPQAVPDIYALSPAEWACRGVDYLVVDGRYRHEEWKSQIEVMAEFQIPPYIGAERQILRITALCPAPVHNGLDCSTRSILLLLNTAPGMGR